jgi:polyisoprenyl-teichoic acid--peptidoglycan teichoic acid transferase
MTDQQPDQRNQMRDSAPDSAPAPRPVYSTSDYTNRRTAAPPPPPLRDSAARERIRKRRAFGGSASVTDWAWVVVAAALFAIVIIVSVGAFMLVQSSRSEIEVLPTADVSAFLPTPVVVRNTFSDAELGETLAMPDGSSIELIPWDGESRFTMIMVGLDRRPGEAGLTYRTDTMMLVSLDPATSTIGVLSIPRDLYVQLPGYSNLQRVNSAMVLGETQRLGYGPTLMMQTVQLNLGIRVHDFFAVDFQAFIDLVNAIGGIDVETEYTINDREYPDLYYGYDPFYLPAGSHHLDGYNALRFARTRHGDSDIQRAERQQQVLYAVRDRILNLNMVPALLAQAPSLWSSWSDNVYTGLTFEQIIQLGLYVRNIPRENITMGVIDYRYLQSYMTPDNASVLIPNRSRLGSLMVEVFGPNYSE